jgi:sulfate permease, SulP family
MKLTDNLRNDFFGGLTAAITALPLAIAFGVLAFAPIGPEYASVGALAGLYGAIFTGIFASAFGGTPCQVSGPTGPMTTVLAGFVGAMVAKGLAPDMVITLTSACVLLAGFSQLVMGTLRVGALIKFIPYPVVAGFMNGIAVIIFLSQVKPFLGVPNNDPWSSLLSLGNYQIGTILAGVATILACKFGPKIVKSIPGALQGLMAGTATYYLIHNLMPDLPLGAQIGNIPSGIPYPGQLIHITTKVLPEIGHHASYLLPAALALGVLGAIDSLLTSVVADTVTRTRHDSRQELIGQGIGNIVSGAFGGCAGAGATVRTLVNVEAGGRGRASGMIHGLLLLMTLLVAGPVAGKIPMVVLAGILLVTAVSMVDQWSNSLLLRVIGTPDQRREIILNILVVFIVSVITVFVDLMVAVAVGIIISAFVFIHKMSHSVVYRITRGTEHSSHRVLPPALISLLERDGRSTLIIELEGSLFFGTTDSMLTEVEANLTADVERVIFDFRRVKEIDSSGARVLLLMSEQLADSGRAMALAGIDPAGPRMRFLKDMGVVRVLTEDVFFPDLDRAMEWAEDVLIAKVEGDSVGHERKELVDMGLFSETGKEQLKILEGYFKVQIVEKGEILFCDQDEPDRFMLLVDGHLTRRASPDINSKRYAGFGPGTLVGELEVLTGAPRHGFLIADETTEFYEMTLTELEDLRAQHPEVAVHLLRALNIELSTRLRQALATIEKLE